MKRNTIKRSSMIFYEYKFFKQKLRYRKIVRLKPVHFYTPSYLYIDYRTLRSIKINNPKMDDIYYPFRGSISKISNFAHSLGY